MDVLSAVIEGLPGLFGPIGWSGVVKTDIVAVLEGTPPIDIDIVIDIALVGVEAAELGGLAEHEPYAA
ncbi:hypothetical protein LTR65_006306 [Meristemomyces frigidus]